MHRYNHGSFAERAVIFAVNLFFGYFIYGFRRLPPEPGDPNYEYYQLHNGREDEPEDEPEEEE